MSHRKPHESRRRTHKRRTERSLAQRYRRGRYTSRKETRKDRRLFAERSERRAAHVADHLATRD